MNILLKQVLINDPQSPHNGQVLDLLIENNRIKQIGTNLSHENATIIHQEGLQVSTGWVDCFAHFGDPGFEFNESFASGAAAAAAGWIHQGIYLAQYQTCYR
jgi:dihydroorotase